MEPCQLLTGDGLVIHSFTVSPTSLHIGGYVTFQAGSITDQEDNPAVAQSVAFYDDVNLDGVADPGEYLCDGNDSNGTWTNTYYTSSMTLGQHSFLAVATDANSLAGDPTSAVANLTNHAPVGANDFYRISPTGGSQYFNGLIGNDSDQDNDTLSASLVIDGTSSGDLQLGNDGSFYYTPGFAFTGEETFTYKVWDGLEYSEPIL